MASITYELNGNEITVLLQDDETDSIKLQEVTICHHVKHHMEYIILIIPNVMKIKSTALAVLFLFNMII